VTGIDEFWTIKHGAKTPSKTHSAPDSIHLPKPSALGFGTAFCAVIFGFAMIWHMGWLAIIGLMAAIALSLRHSWHLDTDIKIGAKEIAEFDAHRRKARHQ